jgi:hypothetical protein
MKVVGIAIILLFTNVFSCDNPKSQSECSIGATVQDFSGLGGCGLMFVLDDGTRLNPERRVYFTAPRPEDDPLYYFTLSAGQRVNIAYQELEGITACMSGKSVFITCITLNRYYTN